MGAPEYVPTKPAEKVRSYASPPRRPDAWLPDRPADLEHGRQPVGDLLGRQGPDQGYALKLAHEHLSGELQLQNGEHARDALAGCVAVGLKRASLFGRAPILADLRVAAAIWGFLDASPAPDLVAVRRTMFEEVGHFHHYSELRHIADLVPDETLRLTPGEVTARHAEDWTSLIQLR